MTTKELENFNKGTPVPELKQNAFLFMPMTVWDYYSYIQDNNINIEPIGQRDNVQSNDKGGAEPSKAQSIVESMFEGLDIGEISIAGINMKEVLEGGHRTRKAVVGFLNNDFPLHKTSMFGEKYYADLPDYAKEYYRSYNLRVIDFYELEGPAIGRQFVQFATATVLKFVEKANSYGLSPSIIELRELVRAVDYGNGTVDMTLEFFKKYAGFSDSRMKFLEVLLESVGLHYSGEMTTNEAEIIQYLDNATTAEAKKIKNLILKEYKFYENVGAFFTTYYGKKIGIMEFGFLRHVYFNLPKDFKIEDYDLFTRQLVRNLNEFEDNNKDIDFVDENGDRLDSRYAKNWDAFKSYVKKVSSETCTEQVRVWLSEIVPSVIEKDSVRSFEKKDLLKRYEEVGGVCEITGDPIHFNQVVGAHIIPHSEGGKTEYSNLMITTAYHNTKMGTMNAEDYKKNYLDGIKNG